MSEELELHTKVLGNRHPFGYAIGTILIILSLIGVATYLGKKDCEYKTELKREALIKADTNQDGILQNTELSDLLKNMGCNDPIPDSKDISIQVGSGTHVFYGGARTRPGVMLGRTDLEKYISNP